MKEKEKEEEEKRGEKMERKGGESKRERCIRPMGVKHPLRTVKRYKTHKTRRAEKKVFKKARIEEEETEMTGENVVTENRLTCENIGSVFYSSIKPGPFVNSIQVVRKGAIILMGILSSFRNTVLPTCMHQIAQIRFENCEVFGASQGGTSPL